VELSLQLFHQNHFQMKLHVNFASMKYSSSILHQTLLFSAQGSTAQPHIIIVFFFLESEKQTARGVWLTH
jgi:hypothetical protein